MPPAPDDQEVVKAALLDLRSKASSLLSTGLARHGLSGGVVAAQLAELARDAAMAVCKRLAHGEETTIAAKDAIAASAERLFRTLELLVDENAELLSARIRETLAGPRSEVLDRLFGERRPDHELMDLAVAQARIAPAEVGRVSPKVGAVVARDGRVLALAFRGEGHAGDHAEFVALEKKLSGARLEGATVFTTLEPCAERSPAKRACADRLVAARVGRVVYGMPDPDHKGQGHWKLRDAGIAVSMFEDRHVQILEELNHDFIQDRRAARASGHTPAQRVETGQVVEPPVDGQGWIDRTPRSIPPGWPAWRQAPCMVFDESRGEAVLFGGYDGASYFSDHFTWRGSTGSWTRISSPAGAAGWPTGRQYHAATYDSHRHQVVVFGGASVDSLRMRDLWIWSCAERRWLFATPFPVRADWPAGRSEHAMAYDSDRRRVVLFGGDDESAGSLSDLWEWDPETRLWERLTSGNGAWPDGRADARMVYDSTRKKIVVFGGVNTRNGRLADTWEWDGAAREWTERRPAEAPTPRVGHAMAFSRSSSRTYLFGGFGLTRASDGSDEIREDRLSDLWAWDGTAWTELALGERPAPRAFHGMACDDARGVVVIFGGHDRRDLWEFKLPNPR